MAVFTFLRLFFEIATTTVGITNSVSTVANASPPITDLARGLQVSDPVPISSASGIMEQIVVNAVNKIGRILLLQASRKSST